MNEPGALRIAVTGGTGGIGRRIVELLAARGARVWAVGRNRSKGEALEREWQSQNLDIRYIPGDMGDQPGTLELARRLLEVPEPLDVLINNVGGVWSRREWTPDGVEKILAVNHVHPFILSEALFSKLQASWGKVIHMSTGYRKLVTLRPVDWEQKRWDSGMNVYGRSKEISILAGLALCRRWAEAGVVVQFADPFMAWTPLTAAMGSGSFPWYGRFLLPGIRAVQKRIPLDWAAGPALALALDTRDRRPGVYAFPGGLRWAVRLGARRQRLGQALLKKTMTEWVTGETRLALSGAPP